MKDKDLWEKDKFLPINSINYSYFVLLGWVMSFIIVK